MAWSKVATKSKRKAVKGKAKVAGKASGKSIAAKVAKAFKAPKELPSKGGICGDGAPDRNHNGCGGTTCGSPD